MVRALLSGAKTQTRRVAKINFEVQRTATTTEWAQGLASGHHTHVTTQQIVDKAEQLRGRIHPVIRDDGSMVAIRCPFGVPGDRLWVRETWGRFEPWTGFHYAADHEGFGIGPDDDPDHVPEHAVRWKPSIRMPRTACRLVLEITEVRVERLCDISHEDAMAEGITLNWGHIEESSRLPAETQDECSLRKGWARLQFEILWESVYGPGTWDANPWVWAVSLRKLDARAATGIGGEV